jgi:hypothetical protein
MVQQLMRRLAAAQIEDAERPSHAAARRPARLAPRQAARAALRPARRRTAAGDRGGRRHPRRRPQQGYTEREVLVAGQGFKWDRSDARRRQPVPVRRPASWSICASPTASPGRDGGEALQRYAGAWMTACDPDHPAPARLGGTQDSLVQCPGQAGVAIELNAPGASACPTGSPCAWPPAAEGLAQPPWSSSPSTSKATCWPPTRRSSKLGLLTRPAT